MKLKDVMTAGVTVVSPDATLREAAMKMKDDDIGILPACNGIKIEGMLTDRDIVIRAIAEGKDPDICKVREVMSKEVVYAFEDQDVLEGARIMETKKIRRLIVLNSDKKLVGMTSLGDLALHGKDLHLSGEVLQQVSEPGQAPAAH